MLETSNLYQPRGPGTGWAFRISTPSALIGRENRKTGRAYRKKIQEGLGTRDVKLARKRRDIRLGEIRAEEAEVQGEKVSGAEFALTNAKAVRRARDPEIKQAVARTVEHIAEKMIAPKVGRKKAKQWRDMALGEKIPVAVIHEKYLEDYGQHLSQSTRNNLSSAWKHFLRFFPKDIAIQEIDRLWVSEFATRYLPSCKTPQAPGGPGPVTIRKMLSMLKQLWKWSMKRGYLPMEPMTPWDQQGPEKKEIKKTAKKRRAFTPKEVSMLLEAEPAGSTMGDVIRIALSTGARLGEITSVDRADVDLDDGAFVVTEGKTDNAARYVPLIGIAREIFARRLSGHDKPGPLFSELKIRPSTGKRGSLLSQKFSRLRRKVLGEETDGELVEHSFRHTWRTAARNAGIDELTTKELGGWSKGDGAEHIYDHGLPKERYREAQRKIVARMTEQGYFGDEQTVDDVMTAMGNQEG